MGVKNLWPELSDACQDNVSVNLLEGKTVAVDLSSWIVEFRACAIAKDFKNVYLRNLYYRVTELMRKGVKTIFVADGKAPELKLKAMMSRQYKQFGTTCERTDREGFKVYSDKCAELLQQLGVPFLHSPGEGEALCAALSKAGLVDGVITSDNDAFLYGARTVYYKKETGYLEYSMEDIEKKLNITRRGMIFIALLAGCDLGLAGVEGVGPKKAIALLQEYNELGIDPIDRMCEWRTNKELIEIEAADKTTHCTSCKHIGDKAGHRVGGCETCCTSSGCTAGDGKSCPCLWHKRKKYDLELKVRKSALADPKFPNRQVIDEYLNADKLIEDIDQSTALCPKPIRLPQLKVFLKTNLKSVGQEFFKFFAPVLADMQLVKIPGFLTEKLILKPIRIVKYCQKDKRNCVEVEWKKLDEDDETTDDSYKIIVDRERFRSAFPDMEQHFTPTKGKKRNAEGLTSPTKGKVKKTEQNVGRQLDLMSFFKVKK